jgi:hypothetical protein
VSVAGYTIVHWADGKVSDRKLLQTAQIATVVGWFFTFDYEANILSFTALFVGVIIGAFTIPICRMALLSMFSKILGPNPAVGIIQGSYMGVFIAVGATAKAVEPLWSHSTFEYYNFGIICIFQLLAILLTTGLWERLRPHIENERMSFIHLDDRTEWKLLSMRSSCYDEDCQTPSDHSDDSYIRDSLLPTKSFSTLPHSNLMELPKHTQSTSDIPRNL